MAEKKSLLMLAKGLRYFSLGKSIISLELHSCYRELLVATLNVYVFGVYILHKHCLSEQQSLLGPCQICPNLEDSPGESDVVGQ